MAIEAPNWYKTAFIDRAIHVYQPMGYMLNGMTDAPVKVEGNQIKWMIAGRAEATTQQRGSIGPAMNAARSSVTATLADYQANDWSWEYDLEKIGPDENSVIQETCGRAIGRKKDRLIISELNSLNGVTLIDATNGGAIAANAAPFTLVMALAGIVSLQQQNTMQQGDRIVCGLPSLAFQQFMSYRQVSDADWVGYDGLPYKAGSPGVKGKEWNGVYWFRLPDEYCPVYAANVLDFFMWNTRAVGFAENYELRSTITWENLYSGWYHNNRFSAVAKTLLPNGVVRFRYGNTSALTIN
ncbi:MAG: phage capsid protein [Methylocystis sp.]